MESLFQAFGLTISSCLYCPELLPGQGAPVVLVRYGVVPPDLPGARNNGHYYQAVPGQLLFAVKDVGRFLVRNGTEIIIDRHPEATDDEVRLYLLGSGFGALLHQRGILALHGSCIKVDDGCVVFMGRSGVGKSTLAAVLRRKGYRCLSDDVCAVSIGEDGIPYATPAYPQAKLWLDAIEHLGMDATGMRRMARRPRKRVLRFDGHWEGQPLPLKRLYVLSPGWPKLHPVLQPITAPVKVRVLGDYTYRREYLPGLELVHRHFKQLGYLAGRLPITRVVRPTDDFVVEQLAEAVEADFRAETANFIV